MGTVLQLSAKIEEGLKQTHPKLRKTIIKKLAPTIASVIQTQTANTAMWATVLPIETERADMRLQWISRLLANPLLQSHSIMEPYAKHQLIGAMKNGQHIIIMMDQTDIGNRFAILMISVYIGGRALPLIWTVKSGAANIGFDEQRKLLEIIAEWIPKNAKVILMADRFYPSANLFHWLKEHQWSYRLRLKGNHIVDVGRSDIKTTIDLARGVKYRQEIGARLFQSGVETNIGVLHEPGHNEPWIIAMECTPTMAAIRDYGSRWGIEPMFSDFKSRGFGLEDTQLWYADRLDHLILIMSLAMFWCVKVGIEDANESPTALERKVLEQSDPDHWSFKKQARSVLSWFQRGLRKLLRLAEFGWELPEFCPSG